MPHILFLIITQKGEIVNKNPQFPAYGLRDDEDLPHECDQHLRGPQIGRPPLRLSNSRGCSSQSLKDAGHLDAEGTFTSVL